MAKKIIAGCAALVAAIVSVQPGAAVLFPFGLFPCGLFGPWGLFGPYGLFGPFGLFGPCGMFGW